LKKYILFIIAALALFGSSIYAQTAASLATPTIDSGDTAWMIVPTAFVLLMSIPGLALFYGGLVRRENVFKCIHASIYIGCSYKCSMGSYWL